MAFVLDWLGETFRLPLWTALFKRRRGRKGA